MRCERCGDENPERARFCSTCGAPLVREARQERKVVSILFVDLVGFTGRSERSDPEEVRDLLESYHGAAGRVIGSFGGNLEKFIGDAVMAVFGAPISHGDDAERAVRAGLEVLTAVEQLGVKARAAVNTGEAVVAVGAAASSGQALAMGDVVNTASRIQSSAPAGRLVVGQETYQLTRNAIRYQTLDAVDARGKTAPVPVWLAVAPLDVVPARTKAPMVGRDREMQLLISIWDRAITDSRPHLVTVLGPPGIGKSRLQREFSAYVNAHGGVVARGRSLPYGERSAYAAFIQIVRDRCGIYENDSADTARAKLAVAVEKVLPEAERAETIFHLTVLTGLATVEQSLQRGYLFFAARRFVEGLASTKPLVIVLEDMHWADTGLLDLVAYLSAYIKDSPLVILCMARPEFIDQCPTWGAGLHAHTTIALEPLSITDASTLAADLLAEAAAPRDSVEHLVEAGEGNPLFIEELASALGDRPTSSGVLPTTIRAAIASRLDALPQTSRDVLLDASVIGRGFWRGVLEHLSVHGALDRDLAVLESRDLIRRVPTTRVGGDIEYAFKHILIHEVAYATLPRSVRKQRHRAVAEYIESVVDDTTGLTTILAHHWREAGDAAKAIEYLIRAADQALNAWALNEAVSLYDSAIALAPNERERDRIVLARGLAQSRLGAYPAAVATLSPLLQRLTGDDRIEALLGYAWSLQWMEQTDETIAAAEEALALAEAGHNRELVAVSKAMVSQALAMRGSPGDLDSAGELGEEALRVWVPGTRPWWHLNHEHLLGEQFYWTGRIPDALALMTDATRSGDDPQSVQARLRSAALHAQVLCSIGRYEESISLFDETMRQASEVGRPLRIFRNYSTQPLRELFDLDEARRRSEESLEGPDEAAAFLMPRANARADLGQAALMSGDFATAEEMWRVQWEETNNVKAWTRWLLACRLAAMRAEMEFLAGHFDRACEWARKAIELSAAVRRLKYETVAHTMLGRSLLATGKGAEAVDALESAIERADRLAAPWLGWQARAAHARALYAIGQEGAAERAFAEATKIIRGISDGLAAERRERFLAAEPVRDVMKASMRTGA